MVPSLIAITALAAFMLYRKVMARALLPFPTSPGSSLNTVLKSLYLQKSFADFAAGAQGLDDAALHARFGEFLAMAAPSKIIPTQAPGEIAA